VKIGVEGSRVKKRKEKKGVKGPGVYKSPGPATF
jgi:hypothetical protein